MIVLLPISSGHYLGSAGDMDMSAVRSALDGPGNLNEPRLTS